MKKNILLALESTAHTFGASIIEYEKNNFKYNILSNVKKTLTSESEGLIPIKIQEHHTFYSKKIIIEALKKAKVNIKDVNVIAYSNAPGIGHSLKTSNIIAKTLSLKYNIPIVKVNHSLAHLTSAMVLFKGNVTLLYTSGANTQIFNYDSKSKKMKLVGETLDIGLGHLFDIIARLFNYGFPGGPIIEKKALEYSKVSDEILDLPYNIKGMDVVLGGLYSKVKTLLEKKQEEFDKKIISKKEFEFFKSKICYSVQEYTFALMLEALERAIALNNSSFFSIIGGVAMNKTFVKKAKLLSKQKNVIFKIPDKSLLVDNAAMIGVEALRKIFFENYNLKSFDKIKSEKPNPYERLDYEFKYKI